LEEIEDVHDFVQKLEKIEPPNQLVAVIGDPLLQRLLQLRSSDKYEKRINNWLHAFFEDQLHNPEPSEAKILEMLQAIYKYTQFTRARFWSLVNIMHQLTNLRYCQKHV
jgi:centromere protein I